MRDLPDCLHDHDDDPVYREDGGDGAECADGEDEDTNTVESSVRFPAVAATAQAAAGVVVDLPLPLPHHHRHDLLSPLSPLTDHHHCWPQQEF